MKIGIFGHKISRQKIYSSQLLSSYLLSKSKKKVADSKFILANWVKKLVGSDPIFLGRARVGLFLAANIVIAEKPGVCLLSPLTILDVANMLGASGATLEYYDLRKNLFECDLALLEKRIERGDVSCLVVTHYFYIQNDFDRIIDLCNQNNISLIEDCAISLGARYKEAYSGTFGRFAVYSFSIFKFLNNFWGGAIVCKSEIDKSNVMAQISKWRKLSYGEYLPQLLKYIKFGAVTFQPIFKFVFYIFKYGLRNNIKIITDNIQNDPFVPFNSTIEENCFTKPHDSFYVELSRKRHSIFSQLDMRQQKALYVYDNVNLKSLFALSPTVNFNSSAFISLPLVFANSEIRDKVALLLLDAGIDCSKQLYRNISTVDGFNVIEGTSLEVQNLINCCLYIPLHRDVTYEALNEVIFILNGLEL